MKKRLCIVVPNHWSEIMGGSPYESKVLIETLSEMDLYDIYYITKRCSAQYKTENYTIYKIKRGSKSRRYGEFIGGPSLLRILKTIKPDIIYQLVAGAFTGICAYYSKKNNCKLVWRVQHDHDVSPPGWRFSKIPIINYIDNKILDYGITNAQYTIAQSKLQNELMQKHYNRSATAIIPNFHPAPTETISKDGPVKVVWVANFKEWKRPDLFVNLAKDLQAYTDVEFIMCGKPVMGSYAELKSRIDSIDRLTHLGECSQDQVNEMLAKAHIFVNTSMHEGFPHTFMQAWMRRTPVVSLDINPDGVFHNGDLGFYAGGDYFKMRAYVKKLIEDGDLRNAIGASAQKMALANYSADTQVNRLIEIFEQ